MNILTNLKQCKAFFFKKKKHVIARKTKNHITVSSTPLPLIPVKSGTHGTIFSILCHNSSSAKSL